MSFEISDKPIDIAALARKLANAHAGASVSFEGWVRDHNDGRAVTRLDYQAYVPLAQAEGEPARPGERVSRGRGAPA